MKNNKKSKSICIYMDTNTHGGTQTYTFVKKESVKYLLKRKFVMDN